MTHRDLYVAAVERLKFASVPTETPDLDARVLLAHAAALSTASLLSRWTDEAPPDVARSYAGALDRRLVGEPVAWIVGSQEFFGRDFEVGPGLLVPRADTETLVEAALGVWPARPGARIVDVATGTGCVGITLAAEAPRPAEVWLGDVEPRALATARRNGERLLPPPRTVTVVESNLLEALPGPWDLVVSNPPYLTPAETADRVGPLGWREPALALDGGGDDGLDLVRRLVAQAADRLVPQGWVLIEAADPQAPAILELYAAAGLVEGRVWPDLAGRRRVTGARRP